MNLHLGVLATISHLNFNTNQIWLLSPFYPMRSGKWRSNRLNDLLKLWANYEFLKLVMTPNLRTFLRCHTGQPRTCVWMQYHRAIQANSRGTFPITEVLGKGNMAGWRWGLTEGFTSKRAYLGSGWHPKKKCFTEWKIKMPMTLLLFSRYYV